MNLANYMTFSRIMGAIVVPVLLVLGAPRVLVFFTYVLFATTDLIDGYISRIYGLKDDGDVFDPVADKALFICTLVILIGTQDVPVLASSIIILREILVLGLRASAERHTFRIRSSVLAKLKTFAGNISVSSYILHDEYFGISAKFVGDIFFVICFALAVVSGTQYITMYFREVQRVKKTAVQQKSI